MFIALFTLAHEIKDLLKNIVRCSVRLLPRPDLRSNINSTIARRGKKSELEIRNLARTKLAVEAVDLVHHHLHH